MVETWGHWLWRNDLGFLPCIKISFAGWQKAPFISSYMLHSMILALHESFNYLVRLFVHGFLEVHGLKIIGFLKLGIKTG
jgi:hypothetical protein